MATENIVHRFLVATQKLQIIDSKIDPKATENLRKIKLQARNRGDLNSAVISAGYYAQKFDKTMYAYAGDSFGHSVWRVSQKESDYLNSINNSGRGLVSVAPDLTVTWYEIKTPHSDKIIPY
jgi:hypothetical protein